MTELDIPIPMPARTELTAFLTFMLRAHRYGRIPTDDTLADAVHDYATTARSADPGQVIPVMISAAEAIAAARKALEVAERAAKEELDAELDALGADADTGKVDGKAVYVDGVDGVRYRIARGHDPKTGYRDEPVARMIGAALRMDYRPPTDTPAHLAGVFGDEYAAGVAAGIAAARAGIGGAWKSGELSRHAHRLARAGDTTNAGLLEAAKYRTPGRKETAKYEPAASRTNRPD